jgi:hypothetical protein
MPKTYAGETTMTAAQARNMSNGIGGRRSSFRGIRAAVVIVAALLAPTAGCAEVAGDGGPASAPAAAAAVVEPPPLVLLVGGMTVDLEDTTSIWGSREAVDGRSVWSGMIGGLVDRGYRFGGIVRPAGVKIELPESLDTAGTTEPATTADLFVLEYSAVGRVDGLQAKSLELVQCIRELKRVTGRTKVAIVAHSAGGVVARSYLQGALPGIRYEGDVSLLLTIGTPHFGTDLAKHFGDFLGTRATALKPDSPLLAELNEKLDLPTDVRFASLVVKGMGADVKGDFSAKFDEEMLHHLPADYLLGGDQVVHAKSQNLALAPCARRYEKRAGKPIHYMAVRVPDPSPSDLHPWEQTVHVVTPCHPAVATWVGLLLNSRTIFDDGRGEPDPDDGLSRETLRKIHAHVSALRLIESSSAKMWPWQIVDLQVDGANSRWSAETANSCTYCFDGTARNSLCGTLEKTTRVTGRLNLTFDAFGRPSGETWEIESVGAAKSEP